MASRNSRSTRAADEAQEFEVLRQGVAHEAPSPVTNFFVDIDDADSALRGIIRSLRPLQFAEKENIGASSISGSVLSNSGHEISRTQDTAISPISDMENTTPSQLGLANGSERGRFDIDPAIARTRWEPGRSEGLLNPWLDASNLAPIVTTLNHSTRCFRFIALPVEILHHIAGMLPEESAIALALTNKAMYSRLSPRFPGNLSATKRWNLLLLLERDCDLMVACQQCTTLHSPFISRPGGIFIGGPLSWTPECLKTQPFLLPQGIQPALCRLLARRYFREQSYAELLTVASRTKTFTLSNFKLFQTSVGRMVHGNLLVRQETVIAPCTIGGNLTSRSAYLLNDILNGRKPVPVCPHVRWEHLGLELSHDQPPTTPWSLWSSPFAADDRYATAHDAEPKTELALLLECNGRPHVSECYDKTQIPPEVLADALGHGLKCALLHPQPCDKTTCNNLPPRQRVNLVRACDICATDMCISAQDVDGSGRVLTLTTWKNLGGVYEGQWGAWHAHHKDPSIFAESYRTASTADREKMSRYREDGAAVYAAFENVNLPSTAAASACWYTPTPSRRVLAHFSRDPAIADDSWGHHVPIFEEEY